METATNPLSHFHIVLVEPHEPLNVGAVARAMANFGFQNLHLISPKHFSVERASVTGRFGAPILESSKIHERLEDCLTTMQDVVGFSGREGKYRPAALILPEWIEQLKTTVSGKTALVFGPEDNGLRQEHVEQCRWLIQIPCTTEFPSFNLGQAVLIALYEISKLKLGVPAEDAAQWNDFFTLDSLVESVLHESGFCRRGTPEQIGGVVRNLLRRTNPNEWEMKILLGVFGRLDRVLRGEIPGKDSSLVECPPLSVK